MLSHGAPASARSLVRTVTWRLRLQMPGGPGGSMVSGPGPVRTLGKLRGARALPACSALPVEFPQTGRRRRRLKPGRGGPAAECRTPGVATVP